jgi:hypothetical protein
VTADGKREVSVARVSRASYASHLNVVLHDRQADRYLRVQIEADAGRAILCDLADVRTPEARLMDLSQQMLEASGSHIEVLELCHDGANIRAFFTVSTTLGNQMIETDACWAVAVACRLKVPILVPGPDQGWAQKDVPEVFQSALDGLDFDEV